MDRRLFVKYVQNRCTSEELDEVIKWFNGEAGTITGRAFLYKIWEEMRDDEDELDPRAVSLLHLIHHNLNRKESELLLKKSGNKPLAFKKRKIFFQSLSKIAAILFFPLLILSVYLTSIKNFSEAEQVVKKEVSYTKVYSPVGSISQVDLPDGTRVWLNHNTTLIYPSVFDKKSRQVVLAGEAYFIVRQDSVAPFIVSTEDLNIVATGTEFNVMALPGAKRIETTLASGRVELSKKASNGEFHTVLEIRPGELAVYDVGANKLEYSHVNIDKHILWREGRLVFENDPLDNVAERLGRFYNVEIIINDPILSEYTYTATFMDETLPQVMELIKLATPVEYSITSRKKLDDGTFSKRKVYISYKGK